MAVRKDTVTLAFLQGRPSNVELCKWLDQELKVKTSELFSVGHEHGGSRIHLKFTSSARIEELCRVSERLFTFEDGKQTKVIVSTAGFGTKLVRIKNLPMEVTKAEIRGELTNFGNVLDVECETYGKGSVFQGIYTETRLVRVNLKKHIPNYRRIGGFEAYIEYFGQPRTCQICASTEHLRAECSQRRQPNSYASRLRGRGRGEERDEENEQKAEVIFNDNKNTDDEGKSEEQKMKEELARLDEELKRKEELMGQRQQQVAIPHAPETAAAVLHADRDSSFSSVESLAASVMEGVVDAEYQAQVSEQKAVSGPKLVPKCLFDAATLVDDCVEPDPLLWPPLKPTARMAHFSTQESIDESVFPGTEASDRTPDLAKETEPPPQSTPVAPPKGSAAGTKIPQRLSMKQRGEKLLRTMGRLDITALPPPLAPAAGKRAAEPSPDATRKAAKKTPIPNLPPSTA